MGIEAEDSGFKAEGRPKFGWIHDVKKALWRSDIGVQEAREPALHRRELGMRMDEFGRDPYALFHL